MAEGNVVQRAIYNQCYWAMESWLAIEEPPRTGRLADLVQGAAFEALCATVILINSAFMIHTTNWEIDNLRQKPPPTVQWIEFVFVLFYTVELILRLAVHRLYFFTCGSPAWNNFDFFLVVVGIFGQVMVLFHSSVGGSNMLFMRAMRILKIAKVSRTVRLMQQFSELRLILNSMLGSLKNLFWSMAMLALIFYLFALVFVQLTASSLEDSINNGEPDLARREKLDTFGSVELAMLTLYKACTGGDDWSGPYRIAAASGELPAILFIFFIAFMQIAVLNILTGIFVEKAMKLAQPDRERLAN